MKRRTKIFAMISSLVVILIVVFCCLYSTNTTKEWRIEALDLPNIVEYNPTTMQEGLKRPQVLQEFEIRIAAFQIRDKDGKLIGDPIARLWQKKGILQGYSVGLEGRNIWFRFNEKRIEAWASADKFFTAKGQIIINLTINNQIVLFSKANVDVSHLPVEVGDF